MANLGIRKPNFLASLSKCHTRRTESNCPRSPSSISITQMEILKPSSALTSTMGILSLLSHSGNPNLIQTRRVMTLTPSYWISSKPSKQSLSGQPMASR
ncbi:hypothetical protein FOTG_19227 [Fusarium oxysporum f. sp. vasinfectum 25433]|uniref:Uncharacterized protein n=1 Tax=Fusarium oxysporum f. sp. vasinfectum 25433 TaxID=1089449 RepID=X0KU10_FUSOX|nr:hypothetical protein FOTG_19227 [Fusarium oxysporum f. sp. vasinfectum 25433]